MSREPECVTLADTLLLLEVVQVLGGLLEDFVDFLGDSLVLDQLERGGLAIFVKLGHLKRDDLARAACGLSSVTGKKKP